MLNILSKLLFFNVNRPCDPNISIAQKPTAIVSPIAGTTRDVIESTLDIGGYPVILSDTAGLRLTNDPVEHEGVTRAFDRFVDAQI